MSRKRIKKEEARREGGRREKEYEDGGSIGVVACVYLCACIWGKRAIRAVDRGKAKRNKIRPKLHIVQ